MREGARRAAVLLFAALTLAYPVRALFALDGLPVFVNVAWLLACAAGWWWPRASLLVFLAGAPLLPIVPVLAGWPPVSLASAWLWALLLPAWMRVLARADAPRLPKAATILLLVSAASLLTGLYPLHFIRESAGDIWRDVHVYLDRQLIVATSQRPVLSPILAWVTLAEGLGLLWLVLRAFAPAVGTRGPAASPVIALAFGSALVGLWAVRQWWTREHLLPFWLEVDPFITRVNASFTDVNALGAYLASTLPVVIAVGFFRDDRRWRVTWMAAAVTVLVGTMFTASRSAWLGALVAMIVLAMGVLVWRLGSWSQAMHSRLRVAAVTGALVLVVGAASLTALASIRNTRFFEQHTYFDTLLFTLNMRAPLDERLKGRAPLWQAAIDMAAARPIDGVGFGRYYKVLPAWIPEHQPVPRRQENAHNYFLQVAAELGLPGLACLLWLFGAALWRSFEVARSPGRAADRRVALALGAGVVAFALTLLTGHSLLLREGQLTFWALAGVGLALVPGRQPGADPGIAERWLVPAVVLVLMVTLPVRMATEASRLELARVTFGFYEEENTPGGVAFRWTGPKASFHVPADSKVVTFDVRKLAPFTQTLHVMHDGQLIQQVPLTDQSWHPLRYVLPLAPARGGFRRFDLLVTPSWRPDGETRDLGVMVRSLTWTPGPGPGGS